MSLEGSIDTQQRLLEMDDVGPRKVLEHFAEHAHRVVSLYFEMGYSESVASKLLPAAPFCFDLSSLQSLALCNQGCHSGSGLYANEILFSNAPALRSFRCMDLHIVAIRASHPLLPWSNLTDLQFTGCIGVAEEFLKILALTSGLESLSIASCDWERLDGMDRESHLQVVHLPKLTFLEIFLEVDVNDYGSSSPLTDLNTNDDYVSIILAHLRAPSLTRLVVQDITLRSHFDSIHQHIQQSRSPPITSLHLTGDFSASWAPSIIAVLEHLPYIEKLIIEEACDIENPADALDVTPLLRRFTKPNDASARSFCPKLGTPLSPMICPLLKILRIFRVRMSFAALRRFVESRAGQVAEGSSLRRLDMLVLHDPFWIVPDQEDGRGEEEAQAGQDGGDIPTDSEHEAHDEDDVHDGDDSLEEDDINDQNDTDEVLEWLQRMQKNHGLQSNYTTSAPDEEGPEEE